MLNIKGVQCLFYSESIFVFLNCQLLIVATWMIMNVNNVLFYLHLSHIVKMFCLRRCRPLVQKIFKLNPKIKINLYTKHFEESKYIRIIGYTIIIQVIVDIIPKDSQGFKRTIIIHNNNTYYFFCLNWFRTVHEEACSS